MDRSRTEALYVAADACRMPRGLRLDRRLYLMVHGIGAPQGSKGIAFRKGKPVLIESSAKALRKWRPLVRRVAQRECLAARWKPWAGPIALDLTHYRRPPKSPLWRQWAAPDRIPDIDKLDRAVLDALSGVIYDDDKRVIECSSRKRYHEEPGCLIVATRYTETKERF